MDLHGKGFFIWRIPYTESGDIGQIVRTAQEADLSHVLIKVANGDQFYNYDYDGNIDLVKPISNALRQAGIAVWGWHYILGEDPVPEAQVSANRIQELSLDGFVVDAEAEFKQPGMDAAANTYMEFLRSYIGTGVTVALSSYRFPYYHPEFPFAEFLEYCDLNMPQVYWEDAHNPVYQLTKSVQDFQTLQPFRPIVPTGAAYPSGSWAPTPQDVHNFMDTVKSLRLGATNFWSWEHCRNALPAVWDEIASYDWPASTPELEFAERYIAALNSGDPLNPTLLYTLTGIHSSPSETVQGAEQLLAWHHNFLTVELPNGSFDLTGYTGSGSTRHFSWTADSDNGQVLNGNDTLGIKDGKIAYHYTFYTITP